MMSWHPPSSSSVQKSSYTGTQKTQSSGAQTRSKSNSEFGWKSHQATASSMSTADQNPTQCGPVKGRLASQSTYAAHYPHQPLLSQQKRKLGMGQSQHLPPTSSLYWRAEQQEAPASKLQSSSMRYPYPHYLQDQSVQQSKEEELPLFQKQELKSSAKQLLREGVRLEQMFYDHLSIIFELHLLQQFQKKAEYSSLQDGCIKRTQLTQKMIMNHLEDQETYTPHGKILREQFCKKVEEILGQVKPALKPGSNSVLMLEDFLDTVKRGQNRWHQRDVIEPGRCKPLDEASANYVMQFINKGLIETDRRAEHFKKTGKAQVSTIEKLYKDAQLKIQEEMHNVKYKKKSKAAKFKEDFYNQGSKKVGQYPNFR